VDIQGHVLLTSPLRHGMVVLDGGANRGAFARSLSTRFAGSYHAVEANPSLAADLELSGLYDTVANAAITDGDGRTAINLGYNDETSSVLPLPNTATYNAIQVGSQDVRTVSLHTLLTTHPAATLLKLDIEGAEVAALKALQRSDLAHLEQISVEFHGAPEFGFGLAGEVQDTIRYLRGFGFVSLDFAKQHRDTLFVAERLVPSSSVVVLWRLEASLRRTLAYAKKITFYIKKLVGPTRTGP